MEGLLLAEQLRALTRHLPASGGGWRFPDARTAVLPLDRGDALWISSRPPDPRLAIRAEVPPPERPHTPFQAMLAARAVGPLTAATQQGLDRVVELGFGAGGGFVPHAAVTLVAELTGRNANLLLLDPERRIAGVERVVLHDRNRYRELRPGVPYLPPPPYRKADPCRMADVELRSLLRGHRTAEVRALVDGVGPLLAGALVDASGVPADATLEDASLTAVVELLRELCVAPAAVLARAGSGTGLAEVRRRARREHALAVVRAEVRRRLELARKRERDARLALAGEVEAARLRAEADLLMAYATQVPDGAAAVSLVGFDGAPVEVALDPGMDARANARRRYDRARKREARAARARQQLDALAAAAHDAGAELGRLEELDDRALFDRAAGLERRREERRRAAPPGIRFHDERGFEIVVGRNARENDVVTFRVARARDLWLHVQGSPGSHVVVRSDGREVPFDTVLFAARLAAGFSPARHSDNVPVDYTLRKNVWKVKGQAAGAVHFTQHKTVYVRPARHDAAAEDAAGAEQA